MPDEQKCLICGNDAIVGPAQKDFGKYIFCKRCGEITFELEAENYLDGENGIKFRACLYYYFTHYKKDNKKKYKIVEDAIEDDRYNIVTIQEIMNLWPRNLSERIDMILQNFAAIGDYVGAKICIPIDIGRFEHILFIDTIGGTSPKQRKTILNMMTIQNLIGDEKASPDGPTFVIDYKGWQRIDELNKLNAKHNQGFIAMRFSDDLKPVKDAIISAINDAGYHAQIMDNLEHNGQIVPEMLYQIRMSDFLVADLTGNRGGVYFEAGYALALNKEVILTVNKNILDAENHLPEKEKNNSPHFDVAQYKQIRYDSPDDLKNQLYKRIEATVGLRNNITNK
ncbi:MAG: hypothetical protein PHO15_05985 [Eubacteriales bacterium]|nr:hypothetical protein [Eubacteriales bacterium]